MKLENLISLRLGFSGKYAEVLSRKGIKYYIPYLLDNPQTFQAPDFIISTAQAMAEKKLRKTLTEEEKDVKDDEEKKKLFKLQSWWLDKMYKTENPLQERMTLFWHNHFVTSYNKVKVTSFLYTQNNTFRQNAFGSFKELTKRMLYDNGMLYYLDNNQNKIEKPNENLSRELLELFTIGIGRYSEEDIKEGARALAGLFPDDNGGKYNLKRKDNGEKTYFGTKGNMNADDLVNILFAQPKITLRLCEKLLKYYLTDTPDKILIEQYAEHLEKNDFKIAAFLNKLFTEEDFNKYSGAKIKDPLTFALQTYNELNFKEVPYKPTISFLKNQGMEIFNPPNVKGWDGGKSWLDSGKLLSRSSAITNMFNEKFVKTEQPSMMNMSMNMTMQSEEKVQQAEDFKPIVAWDYNAKKNIDIIKEISDRTLYEVDDSMQTNMEEVLKYDFDPKAEGKQNAVNKLAKYIMKTPEYQLL